MKIFCLVFVYYVINVIVIATPLAIFEIWLEKYKSGWNGEFTHKFWGKKLNLGFLLKIMEKAYLTPYHLTMFGVVLLVIYASEYLLLRSLGGVQNGWIMSLGDISFIPIISVVALWLGVFVLEDFLWFLLNWRYPYALKKLFAGELKWHTTWIKINPRIQLPRFYLSIPILVIVILISQQLLISFFLK